MIVGWIITDVGSSLIAERALSKKSLGFTELGAKKRENGKG